VLGISSLLFSDTGTFHILAKVRKPAKKELVIVTVAIASLCHAAETPSVGLTDEGRELGVFKVGRNHTDLELAGLQYTPRASVGHPGNDISERRVRKDAVHLRGKIGDTSRSSQGRQDIGVRLLREVLVVVKGIRLEIRFRTGRLRRRRRGAHGSRRWNDFLASNLVQIESTSGIRAIITITLAPEGGNSGDGKLFSVAERLHRFDCSFKEKWSVLYPPAALLVVVGNWTGLS
jgi:hypothetical protein